MLLVHPTPATDSFTLYVKSTMILSMVKHFNLRFRRDHGEHAGDLSPDPRITEEFRKVDGTVPLFLDSMPRAFRDPAVGSRVDPYLYLAHTLPHA